MLSKFKVVLPDLKNQLSKEYQKYLMDIGKNQIAKYQNKINSTIDRYIKANGHIDATTLSNEWFPIIDADVFISHSHADDELALLLAGFLSEVFGLTCFIDSVVWGNIVDLQRKVDEPLLNTVTHTYNYNSRNQSTAYVHLMLSTALTKMMDNSEAIFFLSTNESLSSTESNITSSGWIYHELFTSNFLRQRYPERYNMIQKCFSGGILETERRMGYKFDFKVDMSDFKILDMLKFNDWVSLRDPNKEGHALDKLYFLYKQPDDGRKRIFG